MIRINLLGGAKPKGKKNVAVSMPSMDLGNLGGPLVQVAAVLLIAGAVNAGYWYTSIERRKRSRCRAGWRNRRIGNWPTSRCGTWSGRGKPSFISGG